MTSWLPPTWSSTHGSTISDSHAVYAPPRRARSSVGRSLSDHDHPSSESTQNRLIRPASTRVRTASSMPLCSASRADPPSDGKSSTGRPHDP